MSTLKRTSTKQGLQDLLWVTAQRSMEDAEEIERERRRRARRRQRGQITCSSPDPTDPTQDSGLPPDNAVCDTNLKPNCQVALEEDEGFSDWTQKLEKRKQRQQGEQEDQDDHRPKHNGTTKANQLTHCNEEEEESQGKTEKKSQQKIFFTSKVYMPHDMRHLNTNGELAERTSYLVAGTISPGCSSSLADQSGVDEEVEEAFLETERRNVLKKSQPVVVARIDNRLEQYTHAIETSSKDVNAAKQVLMDLPSPTEPVAAKKNLFEAGDAWSQISNKAPLSKYLTYGKRPWAYPTTESPMAPRLSWTDRSRQ
ncbi:lymphocyte-specific protein 1-like [Aplochiton taeniatus]